MARFCACSIDSAGTNATGCPQDEIMSITDPHFFELTSFFIDVLLAELARSVAINDPGILQTRMVTLTRGSPRQ
jgi:hypothetical protein